jgi:hypothetical protein
MGRSSGVRIAATILAVALFAPAAAAESSSETTREPNDIGVFLGATAGGDREGDGREDSTATIGIEYRRNVARMVGIGLLLEFTGGERRASAGIVPVTFMLGAGAQLIVGAGWESRPETHFLGRLGFGYRIGLVPGNSIRPEINIDFVDGEQLVVVGVSIGWGF